MNDVERVARAEAAAMGEDFDNYVWCETRIKAAMSETLLIAAGALRAEADMFASADYGHTARGKREAADWLTARAKGTNDG